MVLDVLKGHIDNKLIENKVKVYNCNMVNYADDFVVIYPE
jgi:hypothetical protein